MRHHDMGNLTRLYSPVTLSNEWPTLGRLIFMVISSCLGSTINGFFVASFFVENTLKLRGNVFLACIGFADLIMTAGVMPVSAVVLLSGEWDTEPVCRALHFLTEASTNCYSLLYLFVGIENYLRVCRNSIIYDAFLSWCVVFISVCVFIVSFAVAGVGVYMSYDYDYCYRQYQGNMNFRLSTYIIFHIIPFVLTMLAFIISSIEIWCHASVHVYYRRSQQYERDSSTTNLNLTMYCFYVICWIPYLIVIVAYPTASDNNYYHSVWLGVCRSLLTSLIYSAFNRNFRRAFAHLFYYCCCKSNLTSSFNHRHRRALEYKYAFNNVKVHIMHQTLNSSALHRGAASSRDTQEL